MSPLRFRKLPRHTHTLARAHARTQHYIPLPLCEGPEQLISMRDGGIAGELGYNGLQRAPDGSLTAVT